MSLTNESINAQLKATQYAVRGPIVQRAGQIDAELKAGTGNYPFKNIIYCNIGNPQSLQQKPLTYPREVLALLSAPHLLEKDLSEIFAADAVARAKATLPKMGGTGAYTNSAGYEWARESVANYITKRDNKNSGKKLGDADKEAIFLTNGASPAVQYMMQSLIDGPNSGIMTPIPQYPLYSATITLMNGGLVPYYMDESKGWALTVEDLTASYDAAVAKGITPKALVVINPGNPTGTILPRDVIQQVLKWAHSKKVMVLADEVYQENIYAEGKSFHSFREVLLDLGAPYATETQLASFHTTSKGIHGECGRRGGYAELINVPADVMPDFIKLPSINLCPNVGGQIMVDLMLNPPQPGDESYESYTAEYNTIFESLKRRALLSVKELNAIPGIHTQTVEGAMYAFPSLKVPKAFAEEAAEAGKPADTHWCAKLLEEQGVVVVPGSGFGQREGTLHFRTTILPPEDQLIDCVNRIKTFQNNIIAKYGALEN